MKALILVLVLFVGSRSFALNFPEGKWRGEVSGLSSNGDWSAHCTLEIFFHGDNVYIDDIDACFNTPSLVSKYEIRGTALYDYNVEVGSISDNEIRLFDEYNDGSYYYKWDFALTVVGDDLQVSDTWDEDGNKSDTTGTLQATHLH